MVLLLLCDCIVSLCTFQLQNDAQFHSGELDVKFQLATDSLDMMLKAMHNIRDQFTTVVNITLKFVLLILIGMEIL